MQFSSLIITSLLSSSIAFILPSNLRTTSCSKTLASCSTNTVDVFDPFRGTNFLTGESQTLQINVDESDYGIKYRKLLPALSLLALIGMSSAADATVDAIGVPLHGFQLYGRYFLAGGLCASLSHGVAVPFDVVKTRLQTSTVGEFQSTNVISVARTIADQDGIGMLYKGLGPTLVGYFIQGSLKYGFYEIFKPLVCGELYHLDLILPDSTSGRILTFMISGFFAELIGSSFLAPFEAARIRLVTNPNFATGVVDCISKIVKEEQASALFRGLPAVFAKQIPFTVIQLASFESITTSIYSYLSRSDNNFDFTEVAKYKYAISAFSALIAAFFSSLASQPGDTLLSAVNASSKKKMMKSISYDQSSNSIASFNKNNNDNNDNKNINYDDINSGGLKLEIKQKTITKVTDTNSNSNSNSNNDSNNSNELDSPLLIMKQTIDELGLKGLFKGTKARLLHVSFYVVVQFLVYDFVKQSVGLPVTGVH